MNENFLYYLPTKIYAVDHGFTAHFEREGRRVKSPDRYVVFRSIKTKRIITVRELHAVSHGSVDGIAFGTLRDVKNSIVFWNSVRNCAIEYDGEPGWDRHIQVRIRQAFNGI